MKSSAQIFLLTALALLSVAAFSLTDYHFTDHLSRTQFKDLVNRTAVWDTMAGNIRLGELNTEIAGSLGGVGGSGFAIDGNHCFIAAGGSGLQVVDVSDP